MADARTGDALWKWLLGGLVAGAAVLGLTGRRLRDRLRPGRGSRTHRRGGRARHPAGGDDADGDRGDGVDADGDHADADGDDADGDRSVRRLTVAAPRSRRGRSSPAAPAATRSTVRRCRAHREGPRRIDGDARRRLDRHRRRRISRPVDHRSGRPDPRGPRGGDHVRCSRVAGLRVQAAGRRRARRVHRSAGLTTRLGKGVLVGRTPPVAVRALGCLTGKSIRERQRNPIWPSARARHGGRRSATSPKRAGVSKGAVSYALNGRPGVSDDTRDRILAIAERARLVPEPCRPRALGRARRRLRARARAAGEDARARAVLHGVHRRRRVRALRALGRADDPARRDVAGGDRGLPALVGRAPRRRRADGRPPGRRPAGRGARVGSACRRSSSAAPWRPRAPGRLARRGVAVVEAVRYLAALGHERIAQVAGVAEFVHTVAADEAFERRRASSASSARWCSTDYSPGAAARAPPASCSRRRAADRDHLRQRPARGHRARRRAARWGSRCPTTCRS